MANCQQEVLNLGAAVPGFSRAESALALCTASQYCKSFDTQALATVVKGMTSTKLGKDRHGDTLSKGVIGGLQHVVSVDNAAGYAELWYKGGSWYAVTDAALSKAFDPNTNKSAIWEIPGIVKGMGVTEAVPRFLEAVFGPLRLAKAGKGGCGCGK